MTRDLNQLILRGRTPLCGPFAFGHECAVEVVDLAHHVPGAAVGDVVSVPLWHVACGTFARCVVGLPAHYTTVPAGAMYGLDAFGAWGGAASEGRRW